MSFPDSPDGPDPGPGLSPDAALDVACGLARLHRRTPLVFWTADDGFRQVYGVTAERLSPDHVSVRVRSLGFGTLT